MKIAEIAKKLNKSKMTIWNYMNAGKLRYYQDVPRGNRYMVWNEVLEDLGLTVKQKDKITVAYCRVSTVAQKQDLEYQKQLLEGYCTSRGYQFIVIQDIGSGINYNKQGLKKLIQLIHENRINRIVLTYKDRLLRFGNEILFEFCQCNNIEIEIINQTQEHSKENELVDDVLQIITVFAARLYGSRSHKNKNIIKENKKLWIS